MILRIIHIITVFGKHQNDGDFVNSTYTQLNSLQGVSDHDLDNVGDIPNDFRDKATNCIGTMEMSKDQVFNLIFGLAFVKKCVDEITPEDCSNFTSTSIFCVAFFENIAR